MQTPTFDFDGVISNPEILARPTDPETSHDAAEMLTRSRVEEVRDNIRALFAEWGQMSDHLLIELYRRRFEREIKESTVRTRRHEMTVAGELEDSGLRTADKRPCAIWRVRRAAV
jgi:hypothetical protein